MTTGVLGYFWRNGATLTGDPLDVNNNPGKIDLSTIGLRRSAAELTTIRRNAQDIN